jgi:hypothetical protein
LKIVIISLAVLFVLGIFGVVEGYYFLKDRLLEAKQELSKVKVGPVQRTQAGCDLLSKDQVAEILGTKIARAEGNDAGEIREYCNYYSQPSAASDRDKAEEPKDGQVGLKDLESIAKKISEIPKNRPLLSVQIYRGNARAAVIGIKTVGRLAGNEEPSIPGPWDEAYYGPMDSTLAVRKGENGMVITLTVVDKKREVGLAVAKAMAASL